MSNPDNNLLTFLKKNSLFTNSPTKAGTRKSKSKSRSKDKLTESKLTPTKPQPRQPYFEDYKARTYAPAEDYKEYKARTNAPPEPLAPLEPASNPRFVPLQTNNLRQGTALQDSRFNSLDDFDERPRAAENRSNGLNGLGGQNDIWTGLVSYSTSFQSARIESQQCLDNLGVKVRNEIANINIKIENFNSRMYRVISDEFKNLRERLLFIIDETFKEGEKYIREYMKSQEERLAGDLVKVRETLQKEYTRIEGMKEEIAKPNWRKTAGDIIASELENKVEELVKKSAHLNVGKWELGDLVGYRLKDLERDLRDAVRLKRQT